MSAIAGNLFEFNSTKPNPEIFENLLSGRNVRIERIMTQKHYDKPGTWYNQSEDEWVVLLRGKAELEIQGEGIRAMVAGDYVFLPAHQIHRVNRTEGELPCIWLAIFGDLK